MKNISSLTNMLGEFVAFQKTPEFKPSSASMQELNRAVKEEKRIYKMKTVNTNPDGSISRVTMRPLNEKRRDRPSSLVERFKQRISPSRPTEAINEEDEADLQKSRKLSTQSEKLYIHIV
ncbi:unnamed protein product [Nippostrongylus brasiliensis]|uniref:Uncharacterized protein n=1 Tax=Nippostrongylus brasiliensis TaxID=27835 RepID=A0A0N4Y3H0_NIPBR|nr:unnamed protein product [Nippostrongylus brasiliensis]